MDENQIRDFVEEVFNGALDIHITKEAGSDEIVADINGGACGYVYGLACLQAEAALLIEREGMVTAEKVLGLISDMASAIVQEKKKREDDTEKGTETEDRHDETGAVKAVDPEP